MPEYPEQSHLAEWSIVKDGDEIRIKVVHKDGSPESLLTFTYEQLGALVPSLCDVLMQSIAVRVTKQKTIPTGKRFQPRLPIPAADQFQLHIAPDRSHVLLEFRAPNGTAFQFAMEPKHAEGIARKILQDLDLYPAPDRKH